MHNSDSDKYFSRARLTLHPRQYPQSFQPALSRFRGLSAIALFPREVYIPRLGVAVRVLDLGCGEGPPLTHHRIGADDVVFGVDVDEKRIEKAKSKWPDRHYSVGNGEHLEQFADNEFDLIICNVALPYMDIPTALSEIRRILKPNGKAWFSLHSLGFTVGELRRHFPRPVPTAYAMYVLGNGLFFHCTGKTTRLGTRCESFQTKTGIVKALSRAGFENLRFSFPENRFIVEALKRNQA